MNQYEPWKELGVTELEYFHVRFIESRKDLYEADQMILELFAQGTSESTQDKGIMYDNMCISAYEHAQDYLIERGLIAAEACRRK